MCIRDRHTARLPVSWASALAAKAPTSSCPVSYTHLTRIVLLLGDEHKKLWKIVKETLKARISAEAFAKTEAKIDGCFASGHGTVLYFEDTSVVKKLQEAFPSYKDNFPTWSQHTSAMPQFAIWTMLEDMGLGASLQHYNPLIDDEVRRTWNLPDNWMMIAQMPFGTPTGERCV